jgi:hypothetical protein
MGGHPEAEPLKLDLCDFCHQPNVFLPDSLVLNYLSSSLHFCAEDWTWRDLLLAEAGRRVDWKKGLRLRATGRRETSEFSMCGRTFMLFVMQGMRQSQITARSLAPPGAVAGPTLGVEPPVVIFGKPPFLFLGALPGPACRDWASPTSHERLDALVKSHKGRLHRAQFF